MVAIAACASNESLPIVVERLNATGRRSVHGEGHDLVPAFVERVVESAERTNGVRARSTKDVCEALLHRGAVGGGEDLAELLLDLVGASEDSILREKLMKPSALGGGRSLPRLQQEPSATRAVTDQRHRDAWRAETCVPWLSSISARASLGEMLVWGGA